MAPPKSEKLPVGTDTSPSRVSGQDSPPPEYGSYTGSRVGLVQHIGDGRVETTIEMPYQKSHTLDIDDSDSNSSEDSSVFARLSDSFEWAASQINDFFREYKLVLKWILYTTLLLGYHIYLVVAMVLDFHRALVLFSLTCFVYFCLGYWLVKHFMGEKIVGCLQPLATLLESKWSILRWFVYLTMVVGTCVFIALYVQPHPRQLISFGGMFMFLTILYVFSRHRSQVIWRPVFWGLGLQFLFGVIILRFSFGYQAFTFLGHQVNTFLNFSTNGAIFVFGKGYEEHFFAFKILPVIVFFSCIISTLYHLGAMQFLIGKIAWVMQVTMGTAPTESLSCAANIFIGQTEAPILIRPFLKDMTKSELHAVMTGGFATIAGSVMAAYVLGYNIPAEHLLCASVMNAPIALAVSKLFYPETEDSPTKDLKNIEMDNGNERNLIEAAAAGASQSVSLVANIAANLIAFLALLAFVNALLSWFGGMVGCPELSFQVICSYLFMPIAFMMGVSWEDAGFVGELLGTKLFLNEFVAYERLSEYMANRRNCTGEFISERSEVIATYALCGFANLSSIGIQLGGIGPMAPSRKSDLAEVAMRALMAGTVATLLTACVAGILTNDGAPLVCPQTLNATLANGTIAFNSTLNGTLSGSTYAALNGTIVS